MTVGELEHGRGTPMSSHEFTEWSVYWKFRAAEEEANNPDAGASAI